MTLVYGNRDPLTPSASAGLFAERGIAWDTAQDRATIRHDPYFDGAIAKLGAAPIATSRWGFSATAGTILVEADPCAVDSVASSAVLLAISNGTSNQRIIVRNATANERRLNIQFNKSDSGGVQATVTTAINSAQNRFRLAIAWQVNDFKVYLNGVAVLTDVAGVVPTGLTDFDLGTDQAGVNPWGASSLGIILPRRMIDGDLAAWAP